MRAPSERGPQWASAFAPTMCRPVQWILKFHDVRIARDQTLIGQHK